MTPLRILYVEDDEDDFILAKAAFDSLAHVQCDIHWASTYESGLTGLMQMKYDVAFLDYNLGARDGLELLHEATEAGCKDAIVFLTGQRDIHVAVEAMRAGAADYLEKDALSPEALERAIAKAKAKYIRGVEAQAAVVIQQRFVPKTFPETPHLDVAWTYQPARDVGGDYLGFFEWDEQGRGILIADVAGKGVPAALVMAKVHEGCKFLRELARDPRALLAGLNDSLYEDNLNPILLTATYLAYDPERNAVQILRAGHCAAAVVRALKSRLEWHVPEGLLMGLMPSAEWSGHCISEEIILAPGDGLLLYTDGLTDAESPARETYGEDRIAACAASNAKASAQEFIDGLEQDLRDFKGEAPPTDDIAIVYMRARERPTPRARGPESDLSSPETPDLR